MSLGTIIAIIGIAAIAYWWYTSAKKVNFNSLAEENVEFMFKSLSAIGTIVEVFNLALGAMDSMGMDLFQALSRYMIAGIIEILLSFLFISVVSNRLKEALADGKLTISELFWILVNSVPVFVISFFVTGIIHMLYLESIYQVEGQTIDSAIGKWFPLFMTVWEVDPDKFRLVDPIRMRPVSLASVFLIYTTTIFDLLLIYFLWKNIKKEQKAKKKKDAEKEKEKKDKDKDKEPNKDKYENPKLDKTGLNAYIPKLKAWYGVETDKFLEWLGKYIGMDIATGNTIKDAITDKDVLSNKTTSNDLLIELSKKLIGSGSGNNITGLAGIAAVTENIEKMVINYKSMQEKLKELNKEKDDMRTKGQNTGNVIVNINENIKKSGEVKLQIEDELKERESIMKEFKDLIGNFNFKSFPSHNEQWLKDVKDAIK